MEARAEDRPGAPVGWPGVRVMTIPPRSMPRPEVLDEQSGRPGNQKKSYLFLIILVCCLSAISAVAVLWLGFSR
jgi:hypothetical protein